MGYSIVWKIEKRLMFVELFDILTLKEAREITETINNYIVAGIAPVHLIVDMSRLALSPVGIEVNKQMNEKNLKHPKIGLTIVIGGNQITQFIIRAMIRLIKINIQYAEDYDEAITILQRFDDSLNDCPV